MSNIHENCENYSPKKDYCLKFFEENVSPAINHIFDNLFLGFECFHSNHSL